MLTAKEQRQLERYRTFKKEWGDKMDQFEALASRCKGVTANGQFVEGWNINVDDQIAILEAKR